MVYITIISDTGSEVLKDIFILYENRKHKIVSCDDLKRIFMKNTLFEGKYVPKGIASFVKILEKEQSNDRYTHSGSY